MTGRSVHVVHMLIPQGGGGPGETLFLIHPHPRWHVGSGEAPLLGLPAKKTVRDEAAPSLDGRSVEAFVDDLMQGDLGLDDGRYAIEEELPAESVELVSPALGEPTRYTIYPIVAWVHPDDLGPIAQRLGGEWRTAGDALARPDLSPTARLVFEGLRAREADLEARYRSRPEEERRVGASRRWLGGDVSGPSMDALARRWRSRNRSGVSILDRATLDAILEAGPRAFNLRVADPYLRHQRQGLGFTWSFFTAKDPQDVHVHGAPIVEIYGVLEGRLEVWWKPYEDRGSSAWSRREVEAGGWVEVEPLRCHFVRWLAGGGPGKGTVFKAGPGPLAEVGRLGVAGKTPCASCTCLKPPRLLEALDSLGPRPD